MVGEETNRPCRESLNMQFYLGRGFWEDRGKRGERWGRGGEKRRGKERGVEALEGRDREWAEFLLKGPLYLSTVP